LTIPAAGSLAVVCTVAISYLPRLAVVVSPQPAAKPECPDKSLAQGIDKSALAVPAPRRYCDRDHLRHVAKQPCLICGRKPIGSASPALSAATSARTHDAECASCRAAVPGLAGATISNTAAPAPASSNTPAATPAPAPPLFSCRGAQRGNFVPPRGDADRDCESYYYSRFPGCCIFRRRVRSSAPGRSPTLFFNPTPISSSLTSVK
jgi:hypothetical protein